MLCREQILSRAQELGETNAKLDVLPMIPQDQNFDMSFWSTVLQKTEEDQWEYEGAYIADRLSVSPATWYNQHAYDHAPLTPDVLMQRVKHPLQFSKIGSASIMC